MFTKWLAALCIALFATFGIRFSEAEAGLISTKQEIEIGKGVADKLEAQYGLVRDTMLQERVDRIGQSIVAVSDRKDIKYSFKVLNSKEINALAVPGGYIYLFKGLVDAMPTDEEIAGVLAHEVTHVVKRHSIRQMEKQLLLNIVLLIALRNSDAAALGVMAQNIIMSSYSRSDENQADTFGFKYSTAAGYNPYGMLVTMEKLNDIPNKPNYGLFSSHPEGEDRIKNQEKAIAKLGITQKVVSEGPGKASVIDGDWRFNVGRDVSATKALYRAQLLAGALHLALQRDKIPDQNKFISLSYNNSVDIYYDDIYFYTIYPEDVTQALGGTLNSTANNYILLFRQWAATKK